MMTEEAACCPLGLTWRCTPCPCLQETCSQHQPRHPAPGRRALGAGPVSPARLDHLLLLHLEGRQDHWQGEVRGLGSGHALCGSQRGTAPCYHHHGIPLEA